MKSQSSYAFYLYTTLHKQVFTVSQPNLHNSILLNFYGIVPLRPYLY